MAVIPHIFNTKLGSKSGIKIGQSLNFKGKDKKIKWFILLIMINKITPSVDWNYWLISKIFIKVFEQMNKIAW